MEFLTSIHNVINSINGVLWGYLLLILLISTSLYFTISTKFIQLRMFGRAFKALKTSHKNTTANLSSYQSLVTSLGSLIGTGSIAGIAVAINQGGPGTIFWLWVVGLLGMMLSLVENTLGQVYKKNFEGKFVGGPAYYITEGIKSKTFAIIFSVSLVLSYGLIFSTVQSNTIGSSLVKTFNFNIQYIAIGLTVLTALAIFGGVKRISQFATVLLPLMAVIYLGLALAVIVIHIKDIPDVFVLIFESAFGIKQAVYGTATGGLISIFVIAAKRALFASESGLGSMPNITASAYVKHPINQGLMGMISVFVIVFIVCTATAIIILTGGLYNTTTLAGIPLVQESLSGLLGNFSVYLLLIAVFIFGFTSIIGNYAYTENNIKFLTPKYSKTVMLIMKLLALMTVYLGTVLPLKVVWDLADLATGFMALINIFALLLLSKVFLAVLKDYRAQAKKGIDPVFKAKAIKGLPDYTRDIWK